jgi:hypothetical protein
MADEKQVNPTATEAVIGSNEKHAVSASDLESTGVNSPAELDGLPDPDVGKSDQERARLVTQPLPYAILLSSC